MHPLSERSILDAADDAVAVAVRGSWLGSRSRWGRGCQARAQSGCGLLLQVLQFPSLLLLLLLGTLLAATRRRQRGLRRWRRRRPASVGAR